MMTTTESNFLLGLPNDLLRSLMVNWITLCDLAQLDSALCNHDLRSKLSQIIYTMHCVYSAPSLLQAEVVNQNVFDNFQSWALFKKIKLDTLFLSSTTLENVELRESLVHQCIGPHTVRITVVTARLREHPEFFVKLMNNILCKCQNLLYFGAPTDPGQKLRRIFPEIALLCSNLQEICLPHTVITNEIIVSLMQCNALSVLITNAHRSTAVCDALLLAIPHWPQLKEFSIPLLKLSNACVEALASHCPHLACLNVEFDEQCFEAVQKLAKCCDGLECIGDESVINEEQQLKIYGMLPNLTAIHLPGYLSEQSLCTLLPHLPHIKRMELRTNQIGDLAYFTISQHCHNLISLKCSSLFISYLHDAHLLQIAKGCPALRDVELSWTSEVTVLGITGVLKQRPELTALKLDRLEKLCPADIPHIVALCGNLRVLHIIEDYDNSTYWSHENMVEVVTACPHLRSLCLGKISLDYIQSMLAYARFCRKRGIAPDHLNSQLSLDLRQLLQRKLLLNN